MKPTFNYILNDLAFEAIKFRIMTNTATEQDKVDFNYQLKLKDEYTQKLIKENKELRNEERTKGSN